MYGFKSKNRAVIKMLKEIKTIDNWQMKATIYIYDTHYDMKMYNKLNGGNYTFKNRGLGTLNELIK